EGEQGSQAAATHPEPAIEPEQMGHDRQYGEHGQVGHEEQENALHGECVGLLGPFFKPVGRGGASYWMSVPSSRPTPKATIPAPPPISTMRKAPRSACLPVNRLSASPTA